MREHENYLGRATQDVMRPVFRRKVAEQRDSVLEAVASVRRELAVFEQLLSESPWIAGDRVSAADVVVYPTLCLIDRVASRPDIEELELGVPALENDLPRLADHKRRFSGLPGVDRAHPPHWKS